MPLTAAEHTLDNMRGTSGWRWSGGNWILRVRGIESGRGFCGRGARVGGRGRACSVFRVSCSGRGGWDISRRLVGFTLIYFDAVGRAGRRGLHFVGIGPIRRSAFLLLGGPVGRL